MKPGVIVIEGHVQGLSNTRALGEKGIPVYVIDTHNCLARYSKYCLNFFKCPSYHSDELVDFLMDLAQKENLQNWIVLPSNDHAVYTLSKNKSKLEKYYKLITPGMDIIEKIYDKSNLLSLAKACDVSIPSTQYFYTEKDDIKLNFPLLTKGRTGLTFYKRAGKKAFLAHTEAEFKEQLKEIAKKIPLNNTFTQELIPFNGSNKTISFTAFAVSGEIKTYWIGEKLREHPVQFGTATYAHSISRPELVEPSQKLLKELHYTGVCEIEYLHDPRDNQYKLIEINARTWLWVDLAKQCNIHYAVYIYNFLTGLSNSYPKHYTIGKKWMHYITDIPFSMLGLLKGHYNMVTLLRSYFRFPSPAVWHRRDVLPFFAEFFIVPLRIFKR